MRNNPTLLALGFLTLCAFSAACRAPRKTNSNLENIEPKTWDVKSAPLPEPVSPSDLVQLPMGVTSAAQLPAGITLAEASLPSRPRPALPLPCHATELEAQSWYFQVLPRDETPDDKKFPADKWTRERAMGLLLTTAEYREAKPVQGEGIIPQAYAFESLLRQPDGVCAFISVMHRAPLAGRLYALAGIRELDPKRYDAFIYDYEALPSMVPTRPGDTIEPTRVAQLVSRISSGEPAKALLAAVAEQRDALKPKPNK